MSEPIDLDFSHYFEEAAPAAPAPEEACVISLFGDSERAILYAGLNESGGALRVRAAGSNIEESIALVNVRFVRFERLVDIRVREDHFFGLDVRFDAVGRRKPFSITFRDGHVLAGQLYGYCFNTAGLGLYMAEEGAHAQRLFVPKAAVDEFLMGERLGKLLLAHDQVSAAGLEQALDKQRALRSRRIGEILAARQIIDARVLDLAISLQAQKPAAKLGEILVEMGAITETQLADALEEQRRDQDKPLGEILVDMGFAGAEAVKLALAEKQGVPHVALARFPVEPDAVARVPLPLLLKWRALPIHSVTDGLVVAMIDPFDEEALATLRFAAQTRIIPVLASPAEIELALYRLSAKET